jgi:4-amino-4-deoxy-L-arabinose transferase-like glycosyltransferase
MALFLAAHTLIWTLTPALMHAGMPLDVIEGYAIGREWVIGFYKHPALPSWLLEASRLATGVVGWPAYLISALLVAATYGLVFVLGRDMMGPSLAVAGTLLLAGVIYFSWVVPELNHNVAQMPFWAGFILCLWRARERGGTAWWIAAGVIGSLGLYAKLAMGLLLLIGAAYVALDGKTRGRLRTPGPWLGLMALALAALPLLRWLGATDFLVLEYAAERTRVGRAGGVLMFVLKQIGSAAGLLALLAAAMLAAGRSSGQAPVRDAGARAFAPDAVHFLLVFLVVPLALTILGALAFRTGLKGSWGTSMLSLTGLLAVAGVGGRLDGGSLRVIVIGAFALLVAVPIAYAIAVMQPSKKLLTPQRTSWPHQEVALRMEAIWRRQTGRPLSIVAGDLWGAGMVAAAGSDRPSVLIEGSLRRSPWIDRRRLETEGFMAVWWRTREDPPDDLRPWIGTRIDGREVFRMRNGDRNETAIVLYTIVRPGELRWPEGAERW